jgi:beta-xylosidase
MLKHIQKVTIAAICLLLLIACGPPGGRRNIGLFTYFLDNGDGLHLAYSYDGYKWTPLKNGGIFLQPTVGSKLMRDPSLIQGPDDTFHLVWTTGWEDKGFGYASSKDLINWSEQRFIPVNEKLNALNTWAPEFFYERKKRLFHIIYSSTITGLFPETNDNDSEKNHRLYSVTTKDFATFTEPKLFFNPEYNCIDGTLLFTNDKYYLIFKDERMGMKTLRMSTTDHLGARWSEPSEPITKLDWIEGPSAIRVEDDWMIYFDHYKDNQYYGALRSQDLKQWEDVTTQMSFPKGMRHGTVLRISKTILNGLLKQ